MDDGPGGRGPHPGPVGAAGGGLSAVERAV